MQHSQLSYNGDMEMTKFVALSLLSGYALTSR
jgi:hypothetical protein